jgi:hypothetical protein
MPASAFRRKSYAMASNAMRRHLTFGGNRIGSIAGHVVFCWNCDRDLGLARGRSTTRQSADFRIVAEWRSGGVRLKADLRKKSDKVA